MKAKVVIMALIAMLLLTEYSVVTAQDSSSDPTNTGGQSDKDQADKNAAMQLAKEERKRAAKQKKRTMESCLTLVRGFYSGQDQMIQDFMTAHPTLDKSRLLNKVLSQMMIMCNGAISDEQVSYLQDFKMDPAQVDYTMSGYAELINIDWEALKFVSASGEPVDGEGSGPVDMTSQEILMSNEVEEYSDELKREADSELRATVGKTTIFFVDIENMGLAAKLGLFFTIVAMFGGIGLYLYKELAEFEPDTNDMRKELLRQRREKKAQ